MTTGKLVALAVTGPARSSEAPDIPTMQESGFIGFDVRAWMGVLAPAGTPARTVDSLFAMLGKITSAQRFKESLRKEGLDPAAITPSEFRAHIRSERQFWAKIIKEAAIKPD